MKFCPICGTQIVVPNAKFCMECGFDFSQLSGMDSVNATVATPGNEQDDCQGMISEKPQETSNNAPQDLETELQGCREYAEHGYQIAKRAYEGMQETLAQSEAWLDKANQEQDDFKRIENINLLDQQKSELQRLKTHISVIGEDIHRLHSRAKDFSIIIYGRTMAGKSTLMEILTHGNGQSIGKGAQRTTLDVREYYWKGLRITDVPGICSFGGQEDDKLAFEAAQAADLILFLLTDDAPQAGEAECLAQLRSLGKPVLGIINVKMAFDMSKKKIALHNLSAKLMDTERLDTICKQFKDYARSYDQDWGDIEFVYTHLNAAFQSQPERADDAEVFAASHFEEVEKFILNKVRNDGKFLRVKNFIDIATVPVQKSVLTVYDQAANTLQEADTWFDKAKKLYAWRKKFLDRMQQKFDGFQNHIYEQVHREITNFAEYNYENKDAGQEWKKRIKEMNLPHECNLFLQELVDECEQKRKEFSDELSQELNYSFGGAMSVQLEVEGTTPWAQYAAFVLPNLLMFVPGVGWAARIGIGVGAALLGNLFDDKEAKIRESKAKMCQAITEATDPMLKEMFDKLLEIMNEKVLHEAVDNFGDTLYNMAFMLSRLGGKQGELAEALNRQHGELDRKLLQMAMKYAGYNESAYEIHGDARIPGEIFVMFGDAHGIDKKTISRLLGEQYQVMPLPDSRKEEVELLLHCEIRPDAYPFRSGEDLGDEEYAYAVHVTDKVAESSFKLAQQIAGVPIIRHN